MVRTRGQVFREALLSAQTTLEYLVPPERQVKGQERKHWVYWANGQTLILVRVAKNKWGLVLVDDKGTVTKGQYVKYKIHPHKCGFDGRYFYWDAYIDWMFVTGKSIAPYFTAVEEPTFVDGWGVDSLTGRSVGRNGWAQRSGGAHGHMYDLTSLRFEQLRPPPDYPKFIKTRTQDAKAIESFSTTRAAPGPASP